MRVAVVVVQREVGRDVQQRAGGERGERGTDAGRRPSRSPSRSPPARRSARPAASATPNSGAEFVTAPAPCQRSL